MKNKINLFVACPKDSDALRNQKEAIKEHCQKMNNAFAFIGKKLKINAVTYENSECREEVGQIHIKKKTDIIIFLVDNNRDENLVNELKKAIDRSNKFHKPELLVFASKKIKENKKFYQEIKQILADGAWLSEPFDDTEDLLDKVRDKIFRYIRSRKSIRQLRWWSKLRYYGLWIGIPLIVILGVSLAYFWDKAETRRLLIVGGGSARSYIEGSILKKENGLRTLFWLYAPMPSGDSYRILAEEIIKNYEDYQSRPYYPIVISAQQATEKNFTRNFTPKQFKEKGIIIGIRLSDDWLVAYGSNDVFPEEKIISDTAIRSTTIDTIIATQISLLEMSVDSSTTTIYTTNKNSGTLNAYLDICDSLTIITYNDFEHHLFSDIDTLSLLTPNKKWIALGSKFYHPKDTDVISLTVLDGDTIKTKPIYLYFMLYNFKSEYVLPKASKDFLKKLHIPTSTIDSINTPNIISSIINDSTILYDNIFKNY